MSLACAVHCLLTPIVVTLLPLIGHQLHESHWVEALLVGVAAAIGYLTLGYHYRRHGRIAPLAILTSGLAAIVLGHTVLPEQAGLPVTILGSLLLAGAQLLDRRIPVTCCPGHPHPHSETLRPEHPHPHAETLRSGHSPTSG
jgi:hypothetical protein